MKKAVVLAAAVAAGLAVLGKRASGKMESFDWEQAFARMPDNAPPKWMFRNISAIHQNTDRILELLQRERADQAQQPGPTITD